LRGAQLYDALPDVIAELEEENRYDILLFERLRALCPTGRAGAVAATASRDAIQGSVDFSHQQDLLREKPPCQG
jgi:hypothetical protein